MDQTKEDKRKSIFGIELHLLQNPLPSHTSQQYIGIQVHTHTYLHTHKPHTHTYIWRLRWYEVYIIILFDHMQSGQIHNTKMSKNSAEDRSRTYDQPELPSPRLMSLDLGLNITCESPMKKEGSNYGGVNNNEKQNHSSIGILNEHDVFVESRKDDKKGSLSGGSSGSPSWLSSEVDHKEMTATVCMKCHMLVMLCKSSPTCPNCKFMHPPDQNPSTFLKRRCSLLC